MSTVKKAVLLCAGLGTRLRPLTDSVPKCLIPINGKPLLQIWLEQLSAAGFSEFLINSHYLAEQVHAFIDNSPYKAHITVFHEAQLLGTLATLRATLDFWQDDPVLVVHADNLCLCSWDKFIVNFQHRPRNCFGTMMVFESDHPQSCGIIEYDDTNRVTAFHEKVEAPPSNLANAAIYLFDHHIKQIIASTVITETDISYHLIPKLLGQLTFWRTDGYLRDIGNLASLNKANQFMRN